MHLKGLEICLNVLFWLITSWLISSSFSIQAQEVEIQNGIETIRTIRNEGLVFKLLLCIGLSSILFYVNLRNINRLKNPEEGKTKVILTSTALFLGTIMLYMLLEKTEIGLLSFPFTPALRNSIIFFYLTISTAYGLGKVWRYTEQRQQQLIFGKKQAELNMLRNQLQPHFLFNALNNLLAMVDQRANPQLAQAIDQLSHLLRYIIDETQSDQVTVRQEIAFIRNYAEVQLLRFEPKEIDFDIDIKGPHDGQKIEPGLFIPFVENTFKHGTEPEQFAKIKLVFDLSKSDEIIFSSRNTIPERLADPLRKGTGIQSTKERLNLAYPNRHRLEINTGEDFLVTLSINTNERDNN